MLAQAAGRFSNQAPDRARHTLGARSAALWHDSLEGLDASELFETLDRACFQGQNEAYPVAFDLMGFLTNVSECFNNVKGFVVAPRPGVLLALVQLQASGKLISSEITVAQWSTAAASFAAWVLQQERARGAGEA